ncbi:hypothetical protein BU24DRAFT_158926 [Aaosphaeria arxii CBS 175.79]|uniref:Uncharacterized protein n=1 Tax=Aaosphaeria arxii CBS 175.79 TaxID=1450172 RepID=A0A6A5XX98_9PLEO|nr:uncharacterized protein BU24DRAFT_158926 [Aaosphaeria arxii CBS 175.79]KAF2017792.1 hypothetical protein BU24DRAFT_158926 [Aaosphaeria arxii CBS 175.79]
MGRSLMGNILPKRFTINQSIIVNPPQPRKASAAYWFNHNFSTSGHDYGSHQNPCAILICSSLTDASVPTSTPDTLAPGHLELSASGSNLHSITHPEVQNIKKPVPQLPQTSRATDCRIEPTSPPTTNPILHIPEDPNFIVRQSFLQTLSCMPPDVHYLRQRGLTDCMSL